MGLGPTAAAAAAAGLMIPGGWLSETTAEVPAETAWEPSPVSGGGGGGGEAQHFECPEGIEQLVLRAASTRREAHRPAPDGGTGSLLVSAALASSLSRQGGRKKAPKSGLDAAAGDTGAGSGSGSGASAGASAGAGAEAGAGAGAGAGGASLGPSEASNNGYDISCQVG